MPFEEETSFRRGLLALLTVPLLSLFHVTRDQNQKEKRKRKLTDVVPISAHFQAGGSALICRRSGDAARAPAPSLFPPHATPQSPTPILPARDMMTHLKLSSLSPMKRNLSSCQTISDERRGWEGRRVEVVSVRVGACLFVSSRVFGISLFSHFLSLCGDWRLRARGAAAHMMDKTPQLEARPMWAQKIKLNRSDAQESLPSIPPARRPPTTEGSSKMIRRKKNRFNRRKQ